MRTRAFTAILAGTAAAAVLTAAPAGAATSALSGTLQIRFGGPHTVAAPGPGCDPNTFCGFGKLVNYGTANIYLNGDDGGDFGPNGCAPYTKSEDLVLPDGSYATLESTGTICQPGGSGDAPTAEQSYGHPAVFSTTYTVVAAGGRLAGLVGTTGQETFTVAGSGGTWRFR
jgi:hypothetical protein